MQTSIQNISNKLIIAAAGSGKTSFLVEEALKITEKNVLITTFTEINGHEIRKRIIEKKSYIPANITVQTWFSFLLQHGVKPYQSGIFDFDITGINLVGGQSAQYTKETNIAQHYFDKRHRIYSDKISKFLLKCNRESDGNVIQRISRIFSYIFVDEVQDLAGHDLEFLKLIFNSSIGALLVGDPRQGTYSTNKSTKNKKFQRSKIIHFFEDTSLQIEKDEKLLTVNYRSVPVICEFANRLFRISLQLNLAMEKQLPMMEFL